MTEKTRGKAMIGDPVIGVESYYQALRALLKDGSFPDWLRDKINENKESAGI